MKITLCGSTRFKEQYQRANTELSLRGHVVYTVSWAKEDESAASPGAQMDQIQKENLDLVHLAKILNSDAILVVHDGSFYVGSSTRREIVWAQMNGIDVYWRIEDLLENPWIHPTNFDTPAVS